MKYKHSRQALNSKRETIHQGGYHFPWHQKQGGTCILWTGVSELTTGQLTANKQGAYCCNPWPRLGCDWRSPTCPVQRLPHVLRRQGSRLHEIWLDCYAAAAQSCHQRNPRLLTAEQPPRGALLRRHHSHHALVHCVRPGLREGLR